MCYKFFEKRCDSELVFDEGSMTHKLVDKIVVKEYDSITLICVGRIILRFLHSINIKVLLVMIHCYKLSLLMLCSS